MSNNLENFSVTKQNFEKHVIIPDLHGESDVLEKVIDIYFDAEDVCFVFLGDLIDKRNARKFDIGIFQTVDLVKKLGHRAVVTMANHEWTTLAAIYDTDPVRKDAHVCGSIDFYGGASTLSSYGIDKNSHRAIEDFKATINALKHDEVLLKATPYFETEKFIAVHAGVENGWDWEEQKQYLDMVARDMAKGIYELQPPQWFSTELATDIKPVNSTEKIVVSGHAHHLTSSLSGYKHPIKTSSYRVVNDGKRVRLASRLNVSNEFLYIWQDWDEELVVVTRD